MSHIRPYPKHYLSEVKCVVCSSPAHDPILCNKVECINCKKQHRSNNKNCTTYKKRHEIIKHKTILCEGTVAVNKSFNMELTHNIQIETLEEATKAINKSYKAQLMTTKTTPTTTTTTYNASSNSTQQLPIQTNNNFKNPASPKKSPPSSPSSISFSPQINTRTHSDLNKQQPKPTAEKYIL